MFLELKKMLMSKPLSAITVSTRGDSDDWTDVLVDVTDAAPDGNNGDDGIGMLVYVTEVTDAALNGYDGDDGVNMLADVPEAVTGGDKFDSVDM